MVSQESVKTRIRLALEKLGVRSNSEPRLRLTGSGGRRRPEPGPKPLPARTLLRSDPDLPLC
ncbi:MAG: hypothetical protein MUO23_09255 [Anaerolineales bacterium]|nr:hypothetical protein [Anaerolineales bacterium]